MCVCVCHVVLQAHACKWHARPVSHLRQVQVTPSKFHIDVSRVLRARGVAHQREARTADGMFSVDLALPGAARWLTGPEGFFGLMITLNPCARASPCPVRHGGSRAYDTLKPNFRLACWRAATTGLKDSFPGCACTQCVAHLAKSVL